MSLLRSRAISTLISLTLLSRFRLYRDGWRSLKLCHPEQLKATLGPPAVSVTPRGAYDQYRYR